MRTVFMGSPEFAVPCLVALHEASEVVAVVTQPDRPAGRGLALLPPAVKVKAQELGLCVLQPTALRPAKSNFVAELGALRPELVVVVAYGRILPPEALAVPARGCWNVHASLLPRYRGAAPIQWALIRGEAVTGVTLMEMDAGMDTGPMLLRRELAITPADTSGTLHQKLSQLGAEVLAQGLAQLGAGTPPIVVPQDHGLATKASLLDKEHGRADFTRRAVDLVGQLRGVDPWPGGFTTVPAELCAELLRQPEKGGDEPVVLKLFGARSSSGQGQPGEVLGVDRDGLHVASGQGAVALAELQLPGRKRLSAQALLAGFKLPRGTILGGGQRNPLLD
jgi:methionyl-tRNA formyltransferase